MERSGNAEPAGYARASFDIVEVVAIWEHLRHAGVQLNGRARPQAEAHHEQQKEEEEEDSVT